MGSRREETAQTPTECDAATLVRSILRTDVHAVVRFPTGLAHYVYDVVLDGGLRAVARLAKADQGESFTSAVYWHQRLRSRGVPLPRLLAFADRPPDGSFPFMLLERLPGRDLLNEYPALSSIERRSLARRIVEIQRAVGEMPLSPGFGYAASYDDPSLHGAWEDVLLTELRTARERIKAVGAVATDHVDRVEERVAAYRPLLATVKPLAFLDDTTTKNVLVHQGRLSGIVDVDAVCFGDPLLTPALTQMALLKAGYDTDYVVYWTDELKLDDQRRALLALYTAVFGVIFLSELGVRFNRDSPTVVDPAEVNHLVAIQNEFLAQT
ncbi:MAG: phosphotransferase [Chloroflexota bacterium]|nr:phosphotransferase [Chloroflexota bacterium]